MVHETLIKRKCFAVFNVFFWKMLIFADENPRILVALRQFK